MLQELQGVPFVDFHTRLEHVGIHVIGSLFDQRPPLDPFDELIYVCDLQNNDPLDLDEALQKVGLPDSSWDPVEKKQLLGRKIAVRRNEAIDIMMPNLNRHFVGK